LNQNIVVIVKQLYLIFKKLEEKGIVPEILDLSVTEELQKAESYNIEIMYTPTFIIGCDYYIGTTSKEEYLERLDSVQNNQR